MIIRGDCRAFIPALNGLVDMVLTDPAYGVSNNGNAKGASKAFSGYTSNKGAWDVELPAKEWVPLCCEQLPRGGIFACFGTFGSLVPIFQELQRAGMIFQSHITWHKTNPAPSIHRRMLTHANEIILVFSKGAGWYFDYAYSKTLNGGKQKHNHFDIACVRKQMGVTRKPVALCEQLIRLFCPPDGTVLDPFAGSGAIPEAAVRAGRRYIAVEIDDECYNHLVNTLGAIVL